MVMPPRKRSGKAKVSPKLRKKRKTTKQNSDRKSRKKQKTTVQPTDKKSRTKRKTIIQNSNKKSRKKQKTTLQRTDKKSRKKQKTTIQHSDKKSFSKNVKKQRKPTFRHSSKKATVRSSVVWKKHHIYPPSVSPQRIVTRSQTGFNRVKKSESNTKLFSSKEKYVAPNCPHLIISMKGISGAVPNTIVTRSSGKYYSADKELEEKLKLYKSGKGNAEDEDSDEDQEMCCIQ